MTVSIRQVFRDIHVFIKYVKDREATYPGGTALIVKNHISNNVKTIETDNDNVLWVKIFNFFKTSNEALLIGVWVRDLGEWKLQNLRNV